MDALTLWLPMPPDNANTAAHRMVAAAAKRAFWEQLRTRAAVKLIPPPPPAPIARAELALEVHYPNRRHHLDDDNAIRRMKPAVDWLVAHDYLAGDSARHVSWGRVAHVVGAATPPLSRIRLTITPRADAAGTAVP